MKLQTVVISCLLLIFFSSVQAQEKTDTTQVWRILTIDGNEFVGTIKKKESSQIIITAPLYGEIILNQTAIKKLVPVRSNQIVNGEVWSDNPQASRYFWAPNGFGMKKGEGYYQNVWVMGNQASYGFTDYFTVGVGMIPLFLFGGEATPVWITPKFSVPIVKDKFNVGAGALMGTLMGDGTNAGLVYGVATVGNRNSNINFGAGFGYVDKDWGNAPVFTLSAMTRVSKKVYLLTENYVMISQDFSFSLLTFGGRTVWPKVSIDYGLVVPISDEMDQMVAIPWLGIVVPFGTY
jgi:hypothetical protein